MIRLLLLSLLLTGCAGSMSYGIIDQCPYPAEEVALMRPASVTISGTDEMAEFCNSQYVKGCMSRDYNVHLSVLLTPWERDAYLSHELCHIYEVEMAGKSWEETATHAHWHNATTN